MALQKLQTVDAFVVRDLDDETPAIGIVRSAPKILQGGAKELARSQTYQCAILNMRYQGASAGVNAGPDDRDAALRSFCDELLPAVESGALMIDAAKGVALDQLAPLNEADVRNPARIRDIDGVVNSDRLRSLGAVACATAVRPLDGAAVAIEDFDAAALVIARSVADAGAKIVAVSTAAGSAFAADGFDLDALAAAVADGNTDPVAALADEAAPAWKLLGAEADVLFAGSRMGLIDHKGAPHVKATLVVPTGSIPYTTKGALMLERQGTTVLPDFVTTAGGLFGGLPPTGDDQADIESAVQSQLALLTESLLGTDISPILQACHRAEAFLKSWRDELPFGRPFAS